MAEINEVEIQKVQEMISGFIPEETEEVKDVEKTEEVKEVKKVKEVKETKISHAMSILENALEIEPLEIYLPGFKKTAIIQPLTSKDELFLNTARLSFETFMLKINSLIFNKLVIDNKPAKTYFSDLDNFLRYLLPVDRALIIFGIIKVSFDGLSSNEFVCEKCGESFIEELQVVNLELNYNSKIAKTLKKTDFYNLKEEIEVIPKTLKLTLGFNSEDIRLKILELEDDDNVKSNVMDNTILSNINSILYFLKKVEIIEKNKVVESFNMPEFRSNDTNEIIEEKNKEFEEMISFLYNLPLKVQDVLLNKINNNVENLERYIPKFIFKLVCPYCGKINEQIISPEIEFFRKTLSYSG